MPPIDVILCVVFYAVNRRWPLHADLSWPLVCCPVFAYWHICGCQLQSIMGNTALASITWGRQSATVHPVSCAAFSRSIHWGIMKISAHAVLCLSFDCWNVEVNRSWILYHWLQCDTSNILSFCSQLPFISCDLLLCPTPRHSAVFSVARQKTDKWRNTQALAVPIRNIHFVDTLDF